DMNNPGEYTFSFEIGLKQDFKLADLPSAPLTSYKVTVTDAMVDEAIESVRVKPANQPENNETADGEQSDAEEKTEKTAESPAPATEEKPVEKWELNEEFFKQIFPDKEITTEEDFRAEVRAQLQAQWDSQSKNQL